MVLWKHIKKRRTNKNFLNKKIKKIELNQILNSITHAPNAGNLQSWRLILIEDRKTKEKIVKTSYNQEWISDCPILIVVCSDNSEIERFFGKKYSKKFGTQGCAAGIQNMLLKSEEFGISSSWCAISNEKLLKEILKIPENISTEAIICLGYSNEKQNAPKKININNLIHNEEW